MHSSKIVAPDGAKSVFYQQLCEQLHELLKDERNLVANAANTSALLFQSLPDVNWVGFYFVEGNELTLGPFQGKPACTRIRIGQGVCGTAAQKRETVIVEDVNKFAGHIACDMVSNSEIVVPLLTWGKLIGVLDVDSASLNRFDEDDKEGLESVASVFLAAQSIEGAMPNLSEEQAIG